MYIVNIAIITNENYTCVQAISVEKEQERKLNVKNYDNVNYNPAYSNRNVVLEHDTNIDKFKTFRDYVKDYRVREEVVGRFNIDTTNDRNATKTLSCFVVGGSKDFITSMTQNEQIKYFQTALEFLKLEYPTFHTVDARVHFDEQGLPHAHISMLPIYVHHDGRKTFNVSNYQKGKDYFIGFQERFYSHVKEHYPDKNLVRRNPEKDHDSKLSVKEYKEQKELKKEIISHNEILKEIVAQLKEMNLKLNDREEQLRTISNYHNHIDEYCRDNGLTLFQYEKQCFMADKNYGNYPDPEKYNLERKNESNWSEPNRDYEHEL
jgi:hypothetical protein